MQYPHIIRHIDGRCSKGRILDVGCGGGQLAWLMAQHALTVGVNLFDLGYKLLKGETGPLYFVLANGLYLPFAEGVFDVVVLSSVLQMVEDDARLLSECRRVMTDSGVLMLTVPVGYVYLPSLFNKTALATFLRRMFCLPETYEQFKVLLNAKHNAQGCGYYALPELRKCLARADFAVENIEFIPRALGTFLYEASLIIRWALGVTVSVSGYLNMLLYPLGWFDRFLSATSRGCECLVVCCRTEVQNRI